MGIGLCLSFISVSEIICPFSLWFQMDQERAVSLKKKKKKGSHRPRNITLFEKVIAITNISEILRFSLIINPEEFQDNWNQGQIKA